MIELVTGPLPFVEAKIIMAKTLKWIRENGKTNERCSIHINIAFDGKKLGPIVNMSKLDVDWHYKEEIPEQMILNYRMVDFYLAQLKLQGFYILGSLFWEFTPDAIVLPSWKKHKKMLEKRKKQQENNEIDFVWKMTNNQVKKNRKFLKKMAKRRKIPIFKTIEEAINS